MTADGQIRSHSGEDTHGPIMSAHLALYAVHQWKRGIE